MPPRRRSTNSPDIFGGRDVPDMYRGVVAAQPNPRVLAQKPIVNGQVTLPYATGVTSFLETNFKQLCAFTNDEMVARVLRVRITAQGIANTLPDQVGFYGCAPFSPGGDPSDFKDLKDAGMLRIQLGSYLQRTLLCDLQSGDYFLPPTSNCVISCMRWAPFGNMTSPNPPVDVYAEVLEADGVSDYRPLTLTGVGLTLGGGEFAGMHIPAGAYGLDLQAVPQEHTMSEYPTATVWTASDGAGPIFEGGEGEYYFYRDFATSPATAAAAAASNMTPITGPTLSGFDGQNRVVLINNAASAAARHFCKLIFYLR